MRKHILIVEDDDDLREAMQDALQNAGYETSVCNNYKDIFSCLYKRGADLVILDGYLRQHDGRQLLKQIKETPQFSHIPVLFETTMQPDQINTHQPDAILYKAFGMRDLLKAVSNLLSF